jgi:hypothetical protein
METPPKRVRNRRRRRRQRKSLGARVQPVEMVANVTRVPKSHPGRLVLQTHNLFPETGQEVLMTEMIAHPYDERMTAIVPLIIGLIIHLMKRGDLTHITHSHAMTHVTATTIGTIIKITQAEVALIGLPQDLQDFLPRMNLWTARTQATGSLMTLTIVALIPVTVTSHLLEMTTLAVFYDGMIILLMILLEKVLEIMMTPLVVILEQQSVPVIPNPSMGAPVPWSRGILTPRIRVQVDHRL